MRYRRRRMVGRRSRRARRGRSRVRVRRIGYRM